MTGLYGMSGGIGMKISKNKIMITAIIVLCVAVVFWLQCLLSEKIRIKIMMINLHQRLILILVKLVQEVITVADSRE